MGRKDKAAPPPAECWRCAHFHNDPAELEAIFPGLTTLSSAYGSVRADDGICLRHGRYLSPHAGCVWFTPD